MTLYTVVLLTRPCQVFGECRCVFVVEQMKLVEDEEEEEEHEVPYMYLLYVVAKSKTAD